MKFKEFLQVTDKNAKVQAFVEMYGMKFSTNHFSGYYADDNTDPALLEKEVDKIYSTIVEEIPTLSVFLK